MIRLVSGLPGTKAGPESPPANRVSRVRRSKPPRCSRLPWQTTQRAWKIGSTSRSVTSSTPNSPAFCVTPSSIHSRMRAISLSARFESPGGIVPATIRSTNTLFAEEPISTAGPELPPLRMPWALRRSRPCCGASPPWQEMQLASRMGRTSSSKVGGVLAAAARPPPRTQTTSTAAKDMQRHPAGQKSWNPGTSERPYAKMSLTTVP